MAKTGDFDPTAAITLWWNEKRRRPFQSSQKRFRKRENRKKDPPRNTTPGTDCETGSNSESSLSESVIGEEEDECVKLWDVDDMNTDS